MINKHWPRWVFASVSEHFESRKQNLFFTVEGDEQKTQEQTDYFELRMNGPSVLKYSGYHRLEIVINVLVVSKNNLTDIHTILRNVGIVTEAFTDFIPVYKYGSGVDDDQEFLGCLVRCKYEGEEIKVSNLGQIDPNTKEQQSVVQGYYKMLLET
jgi:hypothetical protein